MLPALPTDRLRFGIQTVPDRTWPELVDQWQQIESLGFDSIWLPDHFVPTFRPDLPLMEAWTLLAGLAVATTRVRIGVLVSCNTFRHPALLAKEAVTVDHISHGRLELGLGTGWVEFEHEMFGIPYPSPGDRVGMFGEAVRIVDALLRNDVTSFSGRFYHLDEAAFRPGPVQQPRPPLTLAAHSPRMLGIIAPLADRWNTMGTVAEIKERSANLDTACASAGRDPGQILRSLLYVPRIMPEERPWDSIEAFRDFVGRFSEAGIGEFLLQPPADDRREMLERVAAEFLTTSAPVASVI